MKKKILLFLTLSLLLASAVGTYLLIMVEHRASDLDELIMLHEVEILRERLLLDIRRVEADLYSQGTRHPESVEAVTSHITDMQNTSKTCLECHHAANVAERLHDLDHQIDQYSRDVSRIMAGKVRPGRLPDETEKVHLIGDSLISKINTMIVLTNKKLNERTGDSLHELHRTKIIVILLVAAGPLMIAILGFTATNHFTRPIQVLLEATKKLKAGSFDYRVAGLKNEFAELAVAFDDMCGALREHMRAIEESEKRYRLLFDSAPDAIFILDVEGESAGKILQANPAAAKMHGYTVDELRTMNVADLDTPDAVREIPGRIERMLGGEWIQAEVTHRRKDGAVFPVEISAGVFEIGARRYILAIDRDVTERKQAEEALRRTQQVKIAGELATGLAHEIKNPLAGIKVTMEILAEEPHLSDENRNALAKVIGEIKRIEYLMKSLLNFARPPRPQLAKTDVNAVLEHVASLALKDRAPCRDGSHAIHIARDFQQDIPKALADPMQLQQIFMNLILNAADAMPQGGTVSLKTLYNSTSHCLHIDISDTGTGIDAAVIGNIFQPFFTTKPKGTGLGLAITRRLIEDNGGCISIENRAEGGALFKISLPAAREKA
jgi:two-component system, NtrC family, sensor histidine kinase AtoS